MLFFTTNTGAEIEWHVGQKKPEIWQPKREKQFWPNGEEKALLDVNIVVQVYADGDELDHIRKFFKNIPDRMALDMTWFGETARFIHANLTK